MGLDNDNIYMDCPACDGGRSMFKCTLGCTKGRLVRGSKREERRIEAWRESERAWRRDEMKTADSDGLLTDKAPRGGGDPDMDDDDEDDEDDEPTGPPWMFP